jgi:hypothetical protein
MSREQKLEMAYRLALTYLSETWTHSECIRWCSDMSLLVPEGKIDQSKANLIKAIKEALKP